MDEKVKLFMSKVTDMRAAQKMFFAKRGKPEAKDWLIESKSLEKQVDDMLLMLHEQENNTEKS